MWLASSWKTLGNFLAIYRQTPGQRTLQTPTRLGTCRVWAMMPQTLLIGGKICGNSPKIVSKSSGNHRKWCPNRYKSTLEAFKTSFGNLTLFRSPKVARVTMLESFCVDFWSHFGAPEPLKSRPKRKKSDVGKQHVFCIDFFMVWGWFLRGF